MTGTNKPKTWIVRVPNHQPEYYLVDDNDPAHAKLKVQLVVKGYAVEDPVEPQRI